MTEDEEFEALEQRISFYSPPQPVGWWVLYAEAPQHKHIVFAMYYKPTDEQIKNTEQLLGWTWKDKL